MVNFGKASRVLEKSTFNLQIVLAFGGFGGVVTALMNLLQGDSMMSIVLPLMWSVISIFSLFIHKLYGFRHFLSWFSVIIYNFVMFPLEWISGHGLEGPVILYYFVLMTVIMLLIDKVETAMIVAFLFSLLTIFLVFFEIDGEMFSRPYESEQARRLDLFFNMALGGIIVAALMRVMHQRILTLESELEKTKTLDGLTGLFNRRRITEMLKSELLRSSRQGQDVSLVLLSLENFDVILRELGQHSADALLKRFSHILRKKSRMYDFTGRLSEICFLCVLPGSDDNDAGEYSSRIREEFALIDDVYRKWNCGIIDQVVNATNMSYEDTLKIIDKFCRDYV